MKILIITGQQSYPIIKKVIKSVENHYIEIEKAPISISAFLSEKITENILNTRSVGRFDLVLLPGFVQWNTTALEEKFSINIRKGPEFASDLPYILKNLESTKLSKILPANRLFESSGEQLYKQILDEYNEKAKDKLGTHTYFINKKRSDIMIGRNLPPPIIAEIVNCTEKDDKSIIRKAKHYLESGADIIDIGCVSNKPNPDKIRYIIKLLRKNFDTLISIDSMDSTEILAAVDEGIDLILSLDSGNYEDCINIPKDIPIVILPTNVKQAYFPKDPKIRVNNLIALTKKLHDHGFTKLIADPLLETPIVPGIVNSLQAYFLYKKLTLDGVNPNLELPLFFGVSNVVELMDIDSVGINGLLASIAIELDIGILFTVEHSTKLMGGVGELKEGVKLNFLSKYKKTPPINQGIRVFKAKGKVSQEFPEIDFKNANMVKELDFEYTPDEQGYFKLYTNHYSKEIYILHFSIEHELSNTLIGSNAEALSKEILALNLTSDYSHINYLGRELKKAEICLNLGKPYIQDE